MLFHIQRNYIVITKLVEFYKDIKWQKMYRATSSINAVGDDDDQDDDNECIIFIVQFWTCWVVDDQTF